VSILQIRPLNASLKDWAIATLTAQWGPDGMVTRGKIHYYRDLPGWVAFYDQHALGLTTYWIENRQCELTSLNSLQEKCGIGTALLRTVEEAAAAEGCRRLWLITTNDNTSALHFYQKRGYAIAAFYRDAISQSRALKPSIPFTGNDGIPLRDEIELERILGLI
jgi:GNAT superfamily N-acetyltransferase